MNQFEFPLFNDKSVNYTGSSSNNLNVKQGEPVSEVLEKVVIALSNLIEKVNACSFCEGEENIIVTASDIPISSNVSQNALISSPSPARIITTPTSSGVNLSYNLTEAISSLGNVSVLKTRTTVTGTKNGYPSVIVDSDKTSASITLKPENFPASISSEVRYQDSTGDKIIKFNSPVSNVESSMSLPLQGSVAGVVPISSQEELNTNIQSRLLNVESLVSQLNSVNLSNGSSNIPENSNINEAIAYLLAEVESIKNQLP